MKQCKDIKELMIDYACGDISPREKQAAEEHLKTCGRCESEYKQYLDIFENMEALDAASEKVMATIDWERNAQDISRNNLLRLHVALGLTVLMPQLEDDSGARDGFIERVRLVLCSRHCLFAIDMFARVGGIDHHL